ncbi:hypothetical protein JXB41_00635 [Candidatus Woesearchaeota archaeon]|nr:hypothetical protein [Candidatus Woesearchaeota archaeon]
MKKDNLDRFYAKTAFFLSLGFWIPLFNVGLIIVSLWLAIKALKLIEQNPKKYSGRRYAITAMVLSVTSLVMTLFGLSLYLMQKIT